MQKSVADVRSSLLERREIALIDVRDEAVYADSHPLFAASLPLNRLEHEVHDRIPRRTVPIVVYDAGEGMASRAVARLEELGYSEVSLLAGGLQAWAAAGGELFRDVNTPSKAFGELVAATRHTPSIGPEELYDQLNAGADVVVLDARRYDEYQTMSIPSATSVPGGELALRVRSLAPDPATFVVVNCAGRTRSIIGAQSLINAAIPNRVAALRNGTIGWTLAGLPLEHGQARRHTTSVLRDQVLRGQALCDLDGGSDTGGALAMEGISRAAEALASRAGVNRVERDEVATWVRDPTRTLYRFDVRTPEEHAAGHPAGFRAAPGGQLVQETDVFAPVRGARIVLTDDDGVRANMTASWLAQMGWDVFVMPPQRDALPWDEPQWDEPQWARETKKVGPPPPWERAAESVHPPPQSAGRYKRPYEGTDNPREAMQAYLEWEYGLVAQLERDGTHHFRVI